MVIIAMLTIRDLKVYYRKSILALHRINLEVPEGKIVCLLGANGAGKTTLLRAIAGTLFLFDAEITHGEIVLQDIKVNRRKPDFLVKQGVSLVPQGRHIFREMTVLDNLMLGAYSSPHSQVKQDLEFVFTLFPRLKDYSGKTAGYLSGGEQQMLSIARGLMARPRFLMLDEPSLGLSPLIVQNIFEAIKTINQQTQCTILLSEQNASMALDIADSGYVLENGEIAAGGSREELLSDANIHKIYLGMEMGEGQ